MKKKTGKALSIIFALVTSQVFAATYKLPPPDKSLIGEIYYSTAGRGDTVTTVAERYNLGRNAIADANPHLDLDKALPSGSALQIATLHLLPNQSARDGIVINLPEMRMYYYTHGKVLTYPIGIGKTGKTIPITNASVTKKIINPSWAPPDDIREFNLNEQGIVLPKIMPPGPDNPLGPYAIYTSIPTYLIHSTIFPESVGKRASFGCIRMYESDIKQFFPIVEAGVPVTIINAPVKVGWEKSQLYVEAHPPLEEHGHEFNTSLPGVVEEIVAASKNQPVLVDWQAVSYIAQERDGLPHAIGTKISS